MPTSLDMVILEIFFLVLMVICPFTRRSAFLGFIVFSIIFAFVGLLLRSYAGYPLAILCVGILQPTAAFIILCLAIGEYRIKRAKIQNQKGE
jgi:hypothetical protein